MLDFLSCWNVKLDSQGEKLTWFEKFRCSPTVIFIPVPCSLSLHMAEAAEPHFDFSLPRPDRKGNGHFFLNGV